MCDQPSNSFKHFLLIPFPHMNNIIPISIYEEIQSCQHLSLNILELVALDTVMSCKRRKLHSETESFKYRITRIFGGHFNLVVW